MRSLLLASLSLALLSACATPSTGPTEVQPAATGSMRTVADYFSPPEPFPGPTWIRDGRPVDGRELNSIAGDVERWPRAEPVIACA